MTNSSGINTFSIPLVKSHNISLFSWGRALKLLRTSNTLEHQVLKQKKTSLLHEGKSICCVQNDTIYLLLPLHIAMPVTWCLTRFGSNELRLTSAWYNILHIQFNTIPNNLPSINWYQRLGYNTTINQVNLFIAIKAVFITPLRKRIWIPCMAIQYKCNLLRTFTITLSKPFKKSKYRLEEEYWYSKSDLSLQFRRVCCAVLPFCCDRIRRPWLIYCN